eukprot:CAMPEP_0117419374 /NCGR_PEP_ID=MMETSP0758-20121206/948_1 /TAXON_ID=63605 /ORGANISM="Percolomonas cosmopolitus, Strain AE-1 (ATCC 50343)" /LENGTH=130 /DNA_ID=CAMNT_0005200399 /DNA_START=1099 /DNA_END=1488 /DNA_ORIENTATION=+
MKPITSRPANSERFVVCKHVKGNQYDVHIRQLLEISEMMHEGQHVVSIVDPLVIANDDQFVNYMRNMNNSFAESQIRFLKLIKKGIEDKSLRVPDQKERSLNYLKKWNLPTITKQPYHHRNYHQPHYGDA